MAVLAKNRKISDLQFYKLATDIYNFVQREIIPELLTIPEIYHPTNGTKYLPDSFYYQFEVKNLADNLYTDSSELVKELRFANSFYPNSRPSVNERTKHQDLAIGLCWRIADDLARFVRITKKRNKQITIIFTDTIDHLTKSILRWRNSNESLYKKNQKIIKEPKGN